MTQLKSHSKKKSRISNMTLLAAMTLSSSTRRMIPFARAFSATNTAAFTTTSNGNRQASRVQGNYLQKATMGVNTDGNTISSNILSSTSLYFSTDSSSSAEEGKDNKTSTAMGATVEDDLDTALDEILGAAYKEAGDEEEDGMTDDNDGDHDDNGEAEETKMKVDFTDPKFLSTSNPYWLDVGMDQRLIDVLSGKGITAFTEVQGKSFEPVLAGNDLIGRSRTGTGKTIAFGLPSLHRIYRMAEAKGNVDSYGKRRRGRGVSFLVLCPTRELARQVEGEIAQLARPLGLYTQVFHGGVSYDPQVSWTFMNEKL